MQIVTGNPVKGDNFFDRELEQARLWRKLKNDHILLLAPRRIGKTSLLLRLCETASEHDSAAIYCSVAPCNNEIGCLRELIKALGEHKSKGQQFKGLISERLKCIKGIKIAGSSIEFDTANESDWQIIGEAVTAALSELKGNWLIAIDELPLFILSLLRQDEGKERARTFLNWFRNQRQLYSDNVRWILAGSIGLDTVAARYDFGDTINDLDLFPLGAFNSESADRFIQALAKSENIPLTKEIREYMLQRIGWPIPYYIQLLFSQMLDQYEDDQVLLTKESVNEAFEVLLTPAHRSRFDYWRQRLHDELGEPDASLATHLLNAICLDQSGATLNTLRQQLHEKTTSSKQLTENMDSSKTLRYLLDVLETDGYLVNTDGRYHFQLEWLREYWKRRVAQ